MATLLGKGDGTLATALSTPVGTAPTSLLVVGERDGSVNLQVANSGSNYISMLYGNTDSTQTFAISSVHPTPFAQGQTSATYSIYLDNTGLSPSSGQISITNSVNSALILTGMQGSGWTCSLVNDIVGTCNRSDSVAPGQSTPPIIVTVNVSPTAPSTTTGTIQASVGGGFPIQIMDTISILLNQTISFPAIPNHRNGDLPFTISATASSGLPVSFTASGQCTLSNNTVTLAGAGSCTITASQSGGGSYAAAVPATQTFSILGQAASVSVSSSSASLQFGLPVTLTATITPGNASGVVTFYDGPTVLGTAKISNGVAQFIAASLTAGTHAVTAHYDGDSNCAPASSAASNITVSTVKGFGFGTATNIVSSGLDVASVLAVDLNGDGMIDLAVPTAFAQSVVVFIGKGKGVFQNTSTISLPVGFTPSQVVAGDFNMDGKPDLVVGGYWTGGIAVLLGNGDGTFQSPVYYSPGPLQLALVVGDFNGDGIPDIATTIYASNKVGILLGNGDGTFQPVATYAVGSQPSSIAIADLNGDGKTDLVVANGGNNSVNVLLGDGAGGFQAAQTYGTGLAPIGLVVGDFNDDGKADVATANQNDGTLSLLLGNGDGTFQPALSYPAAVKPNSIVSSDFNGDGKLDVIVGDSSAGGAPTSVLLLGNGDGTFRSPRIFSTGTAATAGPYAVADLNGDGRADLIVSGNLNYQLAVGPPDLSVAKSHTENFGSGLNGESYNIAVTNLGPGWSDDPITVTDLLPSVMTASDISGKGWNCTLTTLNCSRTDALAPASPYSPISLTVNVAAVPPQSVTNVANLAVSAGDPNPSNNSSSDVTPIFSLTLQAITFGAIPNHLISDPPFTVSATASSGLPVSFSASGGCSVSGNTVTLVSTGTCSITASQAGNTTYTAAPSVTQSFTVNQSPPSAISVSPSSGSGFSETFSFVFCGRARLPGYGLAADHYQLRAHGRARLLYLL